MVLRPWSVAEPTKRLALDHGQRATNESPWPLALCVSGCQVCHQASRTGGPCQVVRERGLVAPSRRIRLTASQRRARVQKENSVQTRTEMRSPRLTASQRRARVQKENSVLTVHALAAGSRLNENLLRERGGRPQTEFGSKCNEETAYDPSWTDGARQYPCVVTTR